MKYDTLDAQAIEAARIQRDYAHYQGTLAQQQADLDKLNDELGFPREDLAWARAQERAARRAMPTWSAMKRDFREGRERKRYAEAVDL